MSDSRRKPSTSHRAAGSRATASRTAAAPRTAIPRTTAGVRATASRSTRPTTPTGDDLGKRIYSLIAGSDGITAREIARRLGVDRTTVNRQLYNFPFIRDLCYHDDDFCWHGLIQQRTPHDGLYDYAGWYGTVAEFLAQPEQSWLAELKQGCTRIGRNLNDTRGLFHSFADTRETMMQLFDDLRRCNVSCDSWELVFELRIKVGKWVRIYADVVVIAPGNAFSLEFKMKDAAPQSEVDQAAKYAPYLQTVLGPQLPVTPALVLTRCSDTFEMLTADDGTHVALASGDMLMNVFDERLRFLA